MTRSETTCWPAIEGDDQSAIHDGGNVYQYDRYIGGPDNERFAKLCISDQRLGKEGVNE